MAFSKKLHLNGSDPWYDSSRLTDPIGGKYVLDSEGAVVYTYPVLDDACLDLVGVVVVRAIPIAVVPKKCKYARKTIYKNVIINMHLNILWVNS